MQIDWTTFVLEIVNFLVLVWILKRFLYRPVLNILKARRADIEQALAEARQTEEQAATLKSQFENRLADWEKEKAVERARFEHEIAAERERRMQALEKAVTEEHERQAAREAHRQDELRRELETTALARARDFTSTLLARLAGPELEERLVEVFIEDWSKLPEDRLAGLRAAAAEDTRARVASAYPLPEAQRQRIADVLATRLGRSIALDFSESHDLLAGLRVSIGPWQLKASLADELAFFAGSSNHAD